MVLEIAAGVFLGNLASGALMWLASYVLLMRARAAKLRAEQDFGRALANELLRAESGGEAVDPKNQPPKGFEGLVG